VSDKILKSLVAHSGLPDFPPGSLELRDFQIVSYLDFLLRSKTGIINEQFTACDI